jgi:hypothetical protein
VPTTATPTPFFHAGAESGRLQVELHQRPFLDQGHGGVQSTCEERTLRPFCRNYGSRNDFSLCVRTEVIIRSKKQENFCSKRSPEHYDIVSDSTLLVSWRCVTEACLSSTSLLVLVPNNPPILSFKLARSGRLSTLGLASSFFATGACMLVTQAGLTRQSQSRQIWSLGGPPYLHCSTLLSGLLADSPTCTTLLYSTQPRSWLC